jgi:hypothetical protein
MSILIEVFKELFSMFAADARLSGATVLLVVLIAVLIAALGMSPLLGGALLLIGCLAILIEATLREARRRRRS